MFVGMDFGTTNSAVALAGADLNVEVLNFAQNGRSSKSFRAEGFWDPALAAKPHYVLVQFGHNDQKVEDSTRYTNPYTAYRRNL